MEIFKKTPNIDFLKYKWFALALTIAIILAGVLNMTVGHGLKMGVDFGEGTLIRVMFKEPVSVSNIRQLLSDVGLGDSVIQESGKVVENFRSEQWKPDRQSRPAMSWKATKFWPIESFPPCRTKRTNSIWLKG